MQTARKTPTSATLPLALQRLVPLEAFAPLLRMLPEPNSINHLATMTGWSSKTGKTRMAALAYSISKM